MQSALLMRASFASRFLIIVVAAISCVFAATRYDSGAANNEMRPPQKAAATKSVSEAGSKMFAPYIDLNFSPNLSQIQTASSIKYFSLAFLLDGGNCSPSWGGTTPVSANNALAASIHAIRASGGDVIFSFGGESGDSLPRQGAFARSNNAPALDLAYSNHCANVEALTKALQAVISAYGPNPANNTIFLDFDVESNAVNTNPKEGPTRVRSDGVDSVDLRNRAIAALIANNPGITIHISYTMGVGQTGGLEPDEVSALENAVRNSTRVDVIDIMAFDFGTHIASGTYGHVVQTAVNDTLTQLSRPPLSGLHAKVGITAMIGVNDSAKEVFRLEDAQAVMTYARSNADIVRLSFWSVNRDNGSCADSTKAKPTCSGIRQNSWDFSRIFEGF
jgi:hypothetical protein